MLKLLELYPSKKKIVFAISTVLYIIMQTVLLLLINNTVAFTLSSIFLFFLGWLLSKLEVIITGAVLIFVELIYIQLMSGHILPVDISGVFFPTAMFTVIGVIINSLKNSYLALQDDTESKIELLLELIATKKDLQNDLTLKNNFFSLIAHDMKSPFSTLSGLSDLLINDKERLSPKEEYDILRSINRVSKYSFKLLQNLLTWSLNQSGQLIFRPTNIFAYTVVDDVVGLVSTTANTKGVMLFSDVDEDIEIHADTDMLSTVLRNLVSNAVKFTESGGSVKVSAKIEEEYVKLSVLDTGIGIRESVQRKMFSLAESYTEKGTADEKGTGLGLVICKDLVEVHGGEISLQSTPGKGTVISFTIPVAVY